MKDLKISRWLKISKRRKHGAYLLHRPKYSKEQNKPLFCHLRSKLSVQNGIKFLKTPIKHLNFSIYLSEIVKFGSQKMSLK